MESAVYLMGVSMHKTEPDVRYEIKYNNGGPATKCEYIMNHWHYLFVATVYYDK